jgi:hypothetical protein
MKKKDYRKPEIKMIVLHHHHHLLVDSVVRSVNSSPEGFRYGGAGDGEEEPM